MGVQINIEIEDLEAAGWSCRVESEVLTDYDDKEFINYFLVISKGEWEFASYCKECFYADCNSWGSNIHRFKAAGLFDIPHCLG